MQQQRIKRWREVFKTIAPFLCGIASIIHQAQTSREPNKLGKENWGKLNARKLMVIEFLHGSRVERRFSFLKYFVWVVLCFYGLKISVQCLKVRFTFSDGELTISITFFYGYFSLVFHCLKKNNNSKTKLNQNKNKQTNNILPLTSFSIHCFSICQWIKVID